MDWNAIGAIGQIVGAAAVVATLGYLAIEIRQNTRVARSATRQAIADMTIKYASQLVEDKSLAEAFLRDYQGHEVDPADRLRLYARHYMTLRNWENTHWQFVNGMLSEDEWRGFRLNLKTVFEWESTRVYWAGERHLYSTAFQREVGAILKELEAEPRDGRTHDYILG